METIIFEKDDDKFIQQAVRFCSAIDKYVATLGINAQQVESLKGDVNIAVYVSSHYHSFAPSFIHHNIGMLRSRLVDLCNACIHSRKYRHDIGVDLGLETTGSDRTLYSEYLGTLFWGGTGNDSGNRR